MPDAKPALGVTSKPSAVASERSMTGEALEELTWQGEIGAFDVALVRGEDGGSLVLTPADGQPLILHIRGDELQLRFGGSKVQFQAPDAQMEFQARAISLQAAETIEVHAGQEVDIHSGVDVDVRADHQVNLWGNGVLIGD